MNYSLRDTVPLAGGLLAGALGIALLWAGGVDFPVAVPPGIVILVIGTIVVIAVRTRWAAWLGCALGVFITVGFLASGVSGGGFDHLVGRDGTLVAVGQAVEVLGAVFAAYVGCTLARSSRGT